MNDRQDLWQDELSLWLEGVEAFETLMTPDCVMAFPGMGVISGEAILDGLRKAPRWRDVDIDRQARVERDSAVILGYLATARRENQPEYRAACLSTWIPGAEGWRLVAHQQTPL